MNAGLLNPTLSAEVYFSVPADQGSRMTKFGLRSHPDIAAWLVSILDYILCTQGKLPGDRRIAPPPAGPTGQRLVDGGVILVSDRPDGGLAAELNPQIDVRLILYARRPNSCAHLALLALAEDPDLTRWLLTGYMGSPSATDLVQLGDSLVASLRRHAVLVDELPTEAVCFPDPAGPVDLLGALAAMQRVIPQAAGQEIPGEVRQILGRHVPNLPHHASIAWGLDAGTSMVYPTLLPGNASLPMLEGIAGAQAAQRAEQWDRQREMARQALLTRRYAILREIVPAAQREELRHFVRQLAERGYFPELGDGQVELRSAIHNQPTIAALHNGLAGVVNSICDEPVIASYCYLSCYQEGAVLARHKDRPQCAYNLSLVLDMYSADGEPDPWPIYVEIDGRPEAVLLRVGDGVAYSGTELWHWRDALPAGQRAIICFFHFVPQDFTGSLD